MVDTVLAWCVEDIFDPPEFGDGAGVNPELIEQIELGVENVMCGVEEEGGGEVI